jgi:hypothetical protein
MLSDVPGEQIFVTPTFFPSLLCPLQALLFIAQNLETLKEEIL